MYDTDTSPIQHRIAELVVDLGSLHEVAKVTGVHVSYLSRLERGECFDPSDEVLRRLGLRKVVTYQPR